MKFLHCADLHLGGAGDEERLQTFSRMLHFCQEYEVSLLLIAGDLFDAPKVSDSLLSRVFSAFAQQPKLCVLIAAGNHDPFCPGGNYDRELPDNVYVFPEKWSCVEIEELQVRVWGQSFASDTAPAFALPKKLPAHKEGFTELGVLHGEVAAASSYRAVSPALLRSLTLTYLALGHIHQRSEIFRAGSTLYAQCGCLQGVGFDEVGEKGAYLGEIINGGLSMAFVRLCGSQTLEKTLDITGCKHLTDILLAFEQSIGDVRPNRVKLTLTGEGTVSPLPALERLLSRYASGIRLVDATHQRVEMTRLTAENTLRGDFVRRMQEKIKQAQRSGESGETEKEALKWGLMAFDGEVKTDVD